MKRRSLLRAVAAMSVLAVVGAACAKSNTPAATTSPTGSADCATAPGCVTVAAGDPIEIGTLLSISGDTKSLGLDSQYGVRLAVDYLDGKFDGSRRPDRRPRRQARERGRRLLGRRRPDRRHHARRRPADRRRRSARVAPARRWASRTRSCRPRASPLISPSATNPALTADGTHQPYWFRTAHNDRIQAAVVSDFAVQKLRAKTAATIHDESPYTAGPHRRRSRPTSRPRAARSPTRSHQQRRHRLQVAAHQDRAEPAGRDLRARTSTRPAH